MPRRILLLLPWMLILALESHAQDLANYTPDIVAFGPHGERGDIKIKFRSDFIERFKRHFSDPTMIVWITESNVCHDSVEACRANSLKVPHCRLQVLRQQASSDFTLRSGKEYGPMINQNHEVDIKIIQGVARPYGAFSHEWKVVDTADKAQITLDCSPGAGMNDSMMTGNMLTRIGDEVFQFSRILANPIPDLPVKYQNSNQRIVPSVVKEGSTKGHGE